MWKVETGLFASTSATGALDTSAPVWVFISTSVSEEGLDSVEDSDVCFECCLLASILGLDSFAPTIATSIAIADKPAET